MEKLPNLQNDSFFSKTDLDTHNENIQVLVRIRPLSSKELSEGARSCILLDPQNPQKIILDCKPEIKTFSFDYVGNDQMTQKSLFELIGMPLSLICLEGYNICIFAYGQTGAGKTYTMQGRCESPDEKGLQPKVFEYLFELVKKMKQEEDCEIAIKCSYLEIYNEQINDLLKCGNTGLQIREDVKKGPYVEGLSEENPDSGEGLLEIMKKGIRNRHVGSTYMNSESSRSHSIFTILVESKKKCNTIINQKVSKLNFVDLAGSERQKQSGTAGNRLREAGNINKSLTILGCVINSLVESNQRKSRHIPYRDSKLTFILRDSLGGNSKTCMIAAISSASTSFCETLSTLKFAQRAKLIKNKACINEESTGNVEMLKLEIKRLKEEIINMSHIRLSNDNSIGNLTGLYENNEKDKEKEKFFWILLKKTKEIQGDLLKKLMEKDQDFNHNLIISEKFKENNLLLEEVQRVLQELLIKRSEIKSILEQNPSEKLDNFSILTEKNLEFTEIFPDDFEAFIKTFLKPEVFTEDSLRNLVEKERLHCDNLEQNAQRIQEDLETLQLSYNYEKEENRRKNEQIRILEQKTLQIEKFRDSETRISLENRSLLEENQAFRVNEEILKKDYGVLMNKFEEIQIDCALIKTSEDDYKRAFEEIKQESGLFLEKFRNLELEKEQLEVENFEIREENAGLEEKFEALMIENEIIICEKKECFDNFEREKGEFHNKLMRFERELCEKKQEIEVFHEENSSFRLEIEVMRHDLSKYKEELSESKRKSEEITNENKRISEVITKVSQENEDLKAKNQMEIVKLNELLIAIKEKIRERDSKIEVLLKENEAKEQELFRTAINLQEILNQSKVAFEELRMVEDVKKENEKLKNSLDISFEENERLNDLYKKLEYQSNIMKANYKIKENEIRKAVEEKKLAELMMNKYSRQTVILSERMNNLNYQKGVYEENNEKNKENHLGNDRLKEMRQENVELKNQVMNQKEICDNYRKKIEELSKKNLMDPKKVIFQIEESMKFREEIKGLRLEKKMIFDNCEKLSRLFMTKKEGFQFLEEEIDMEKFFSKIEGMIYELKERENKVFEKENELEFNHSKLLLVKEEYNLLIKNIELKKTEFSPHRLEKFNMSFRTEEFEKYEIFSKSEHILKKQKSVQIEDYLSIPKKKIKLN